MSEIRDIPAPPTAAEASSAAAADKLRSDATGAAGIELKKDANEAVNKNLPDLTIEMDEIKKGEYEPGKKDEYEPGKKGEYEPGRDGSPDGGGKKNFEPSSTEQDPATKLEKNPLPKVELDLKVVPAPSPGTDHGPLTRSMPSGIATAIT
ncbi:MAG: hypothetical protein C0507_13220 [Cyanobacteria bacterium PR.3.49]|nr:hypothetical protein [Cyanobacteria bacterium PR.3.49]